MRSVKSTEEVYELIRQKRPFLACFEAEWCGDCHFLKPAYGELERHFFPLVEFISIDADFFRDIARAHEVMGIPSFVLFHSSQEIFRLVNSRRKTKEDVIEFLEKGLTFLPRNAKEHT